MEVLRTPDERFEGLADFPFQPHYVEVDDGDGGRLRVHYLDERPAGWTEGGETVLCMHGQPTWSYLYRKMIGPLVEAGLRVVAPDLVGFGRSDKPTQRSDYTYAAHVHWMQGFVNALDLQQTTLVCQDWGGLIGLRVLTAEPQRFVRAVAANTALPDGTGIPDEMTDALHELLADTPALPTPEMALKLAGGDTDRPAFMYWIRHCDAYPDFSPAEVISLTLRQCTDEQRRAYAAPFPSEEYQQGARQFPSLVPIIPDNPAIADNRRAWEVLRQWDKPFLTAFSDSDPVTAGQEKRFQKEIPGAKGREHPTIQGAGHFLQEDADEELAAIIARFISDTPA